MHDSDSIPIEEYRLMNRPFPPVDACGHGMQSASLPKPPMSSDLEWFDDVSPVLTSLYLIKDFLDRGTLSVVYGASGSGKTFFSLDVSYHIALSLSWRGYRVDGGTVLYLAAEGGRGTLNRISALKVTHRALGVPLAVRRAGLDLLRPDADVGRVIEMAKEVGPVALIVIDTLSRVLAGGDENGPVDMTAFVANCDRIREETGAHVMIVHHSGKEAARGARGHSSLKAALDTEIEVVADASGVRTVTVHKQRDLPSGLIFNFTLNSVEIGIDQDGDPVRSCVVEVIDVPETMPQHKKISRKDQMVLNSLDDALQAHGSKRQGTDWPSNVLIVGVDDWKPHFHRHCPTDIKDDATPKQVADAKRAAFYRARQRLLEAGLIAVFDDQYWRCRDNDQA